MGGSSGFVIQTSGLRTDSALERLGTEYLQKIVDYASARVLSADLKSSVDAAYKLINEFSPEKLRVVNF